MDQEDGQDGVNKRTFRFKPAHDIVLLKEVARNRPWTAVHGETMAVWEAIGAAFNTQLSAARTGGREIDPKACQRRYKALMDAYLSGDLASLRSTGAPEDVAERERLIADMHQLAKDFRSDRGDRRASRGDAGASDSPLPDVSLPTLLMNSAPHSAPQGDATVARRVEINGASNKTGPAPKKQRTGGSTLGDGIVPTAISAPMAWEFLQRHLEAENTRRQHEMRLAEQKLELDKQRFELEKRERESHVTMMNAQLDLIQQLVRQLQHR